MTSSEKTHRQLGELAAHLTTRRTAILEAARGAARRDPAQTTVHSLTRAQFYDHLPQVLDAFEQGLGARAGGSQEALAEIKQKQEEIKHGLHRWQQGYRLLELLREWGHLHHCLLDELEAFAHSRPDLEKATLVEANRELVGLVNDAISESAGKYAELQQAEAAGYLRDLQGTLARVRALDGQRTELIHQAVHDLRGDVQAVSSAAEVLRDAGIPEGERSTVIDLVQQSTDALSATLHDLMDLARLDAGQERRELAPIDAPALIGEFCQRNQPLAHERGLYLRMEGPAALAVQGDPIKIRRILKNLVLNALKYTESGGVVVSWGEEGGGSWWIKIKDTGPGLLAGPGAPIVGNLKDATATARESDQQTTRNGEKSSNVLRLPPGDPAAVRLPSHQQPGEGIGLSIVKRLCDLLDASLELASSVQDGTTFRIVLPRRYE